MAAGGAQPQLRLAFVGCGAIAERHAAAVRAVNRGAGYARVVVAVCVDTDVEKAERVAAACVAPVEGAMDAWGMPLARGLPQTERPRAAAGIDAALGAGVDAVLLMVPPHLNEQFALRVIAAGKHLLLEKPMAPTVAGARRLAAAARGAPGLVCAVAEFAAFWPEVLATDKLLRRGAVGRVVAGRAHFSHGLGNTLQKGMWRSKLAEAGGGIVIDTGCHWIRPLRMWLGEVEAVVGVTRQYSDVLEGESLARALLRHAGGAVSSIDFVMNDAGALAAQPWFTVTGTAGEVAVHPPAPSDVAGAALGTGSPALRLHTAAAPGGEPVATAGRVSPAEQSMIAMYEDQLAAFASAALGGGRGDLPPFDAGLGEVAIAEALYRSARTGAWERVELADAPTMPAAPAAPARL